MLATTDVYLQRLVALREHGFPLAEQREREGRLKFGFFMSSCGTYGCLLGWWITTEYAKADGWGLACGVLPKWGNESTGSACQYFGITPEQLFRLFGGNDSGTLADRRAYLDAMIAKRMQVAA